MTAITIDEIKRDFGSYLRQVRKGISLVIFEADQPIAELRPIDDQRQTTLEPEIQQVYGELRDLVVRSAENPALGPEIDRVRSRLHALQVREVEFMKQRAAARRSSIMASGASFCLTLTSRMMSPLFGMESTLPTQGGAAALVTVRCARCPTNHQP